MAELALEVIGLRVGYGRRRTLLRPWVVERPTIPDLELRVERGTAHGLVGESGSGKSTLALSILGLVPPWQGTVCVHGRRLPLSVKQRDADELHSIQMVFQDPRSSLNPRMRVATILREALSPRGGRRVPMQPILELLEAVGLNASHLDRLPHEFSGGQQQRIAIARCLLSRPEVLVLDEAVSALDLSIQAQVLNLLKELQRERQLTYLFISHDLAVVGFLCSRISVMYRGRIVEQGSRDQILRSPRHPYTRALLAAIPGKSLLGIEPVDPALGETVRTTGPCPWSEPGAPADAIPYREVEPGHRVACSCALHYDRAVQALEAAQ